MIMSHYIYTTACPLHKLSLKKWYFISIFTLKLLKHKLQIHIYSGRALSLVLIRV